MKPRLLLLFCCIQMVSFAQRFGVDAGYVYSWNNFKTVPYKYAPDYRPEQHSGQFVFPNFSFTAYVKIYKRLSVSTGADIVKYRIKEIFYHPNSYDFEADYSISETHVPLMLRVEAFCFKGEHKLSFYGGIFGRIIGTRSGGIYWKNTGMIAVNPEITFHENKQLYTCITGGVHQTYRLRSFMELFIDIRIKYMPGYYSTDRAAYTYLVENVQMSNKFSYNLAVGVGFFKPDKEKTSNTNPARLQD